MKFNIDIYFFDKFGRKVGESLNTPPGVDTIEVEGVQYVVECLPRQNKSV